MQVTDFDFLSWLALTAFFPGDLEIELRELGIDENLIWMVVRSDAVKNADVVALYRDYGRDCAFFTKDSDWFTRWIDYNRKRYDSLKAAQVRRQNPDRDSVLVTRRREHTIGFCAACGGTYHTAQELNANDNEQGTS